MSIFLPHDIEEIWKSINGRLVFQQSQNAAIAQAVNPWITTAVIVGKQHEERKKLKEASDLLLEWCAAHRREVDDIVGDDHDHVAQPVYNAQIVTLERALQAIPNGYIAPVPRSWNIAAPMIWQAAGRELRLIGKPVGSTATALAIRFTSGLLKRAGYLRATPDAVRKEIEKFKAMVSASKDVPTPTANDT